MEVGKRLDDMTPNDSIAATFDAGAIGYFSSRTVINLDGLANSYPYFNEHLRPGKIADYLTSQQVTHFLLRDNHANNHQAVLAGDYEQVDYIPDPDLQLIRTNELFRYTIPGTFTVIAYRIHP
jgi:hypothetical protein